MDAGAGAGLRALAAGAVVALVALAAPATAAAGPEVPVPIAGPDAQLTRDLDGVVGASPPDTCLTVEIDGTEVYDHRGDDLQVPASTQKLLTAGAVLDRFGPDHRLKTEVVAVTAPQGGVLASDLVLVGGGDPVLTSSIYREVRNLDDGRPLTSLDDLADQLVAAGIRRVEGRVVGDDQRYDRLRTVPTWPARYVAQEQSGPLSALTVDRGYQLVPDDDGLRPRRTEDPALASAQTLTALLRAKGVEVVGPPAAGEAPDAATPLASVASPPMSALTSDLLRRSDNQMAELLLKELGLAAEGEGSTAAGARAVAAWAAQTEGAAPPGAFVADGSGLDRTNQVTCRSLVALLAADARGGGAVVGGLPVAGEDGTVADRFDDTAAPGVLAAKTGSLAGVTALAGVVQLPDGGRATFAYVVNADAISAEILVAQDLLAQVLASFRPPCGPDRPPIAAPVRSQLAALTVAALPIGGLALPVGEQIVAELESAPTPVVDRCTAAATPALALDDRASG